MTHLLPTSRLNRNSDSGFSLVEMAVVLIIFSLLAGGIMLTLGAQQDIQKTNEARRQLADIREAILGYVVANGRLPTPADPTIISGTAGAGESDSSRLSPPFDGLGVLPWATLGLPETDPWGQRFTYRVRPEFADAIALNTTAPCVLSPGPAQSSFALCSDGNITITDGAQNIATKIPAIVISHGKNGLGGYRPDGIQVSGAAGEELENANGNTTFVSHSQSSNFDDEVTWIPLFNLMSKMIAAGRLP